MRWGTRRRCVALHLLGARCRSSSRGSLGRLQGRGCGSCGGGGLGLLHLHDQPANLDLGVLQQLPALLKRPCDLHLLGGDLDDQLLGLGALGHKLSVAQFDGAFKASISRTVAADC